MNKKGGSNGSGNNGSGNTGSGHPGSGYPGSNGNGPGKYGPGYGEYQPKGALYDKDSLYGSEEINLKELWNVLWLNKKLIALIGGTVLLATIAIAITLPNVYVSTSKLVIKQERPDELELLNPVTQTMNTGQEKDPVSLEIELIRNTEAITENVLQQLLMNPLGMDGEPLPLFSSYLDSDNWTTLPATISDSTNQTGSASTAMGQAGMYDPSNKYTFHTVFDSLSQQQRQRMVTTLLQSLPGMVDIRELQSGGRQDNDVSMLQIRSESTSPYQAQRLVSAYVTQTIRYDKEETSRNLKTAEEYLTDMVNSRNQDIEARAAEINDLKRGDWELVTDETGELTTAELRQLENELTEIEFQRELTTDIIKRLEQEKEYALTMLANNQVNTTRNWIEYLNESILELQIRSESYLVEDSLLAEDPSRNPEYSVIVERIDYLEQKKQEYQKQYVDNVNEQQGLSEESVTDYILQLRRDIEEQESNVQNLGQQATFLRNEIDTIQSQYFGLLDRVLDLQLRQKQLGFSESLYETLLQKLQDTQYALETQTERFQVIQQASLPEIPISPNRARITLIGAILGFMLGGGFVLLRHALDDKIRTPQHIKDLGLNFLGVVPDLEGYFAHQKATQNGSHDGVSNGVYNGAQNGVDSSSNGDTYNGSASDTESTKQSPAENKRGKNIQLDAICYLDPMSQGAEAFRRIRASLSYTNVDQGNEVLLVTSSLPAEGKTITALNLAITFAQSGENVALVDADLHKPRVARALGLEVTHGLSDVLGTHIGLQEALTASNIPNLDVLTAGQRVENPAELVSSKRMATTIEALQSDYDRIIIDTPPIQAVSDALFIAAHCSGVVIISKANESKTGHLQSIYEELAKLDIPILGAALNYFNPYKQEGLMTYTTDTRYRDSYQYAYVYRGKRSSKYGYSKDYRISYRDEESTHV
ncbi:MAG: polysaccharide biosynthesis tyrosine autokinase [Balneolaceae bacterium]|nr:polysaccharide biosynthesis tyrosine autokinase [Balneolaceae bacterium]